MANDQLSTSSSSGEQTNTGSPQSVPNASNLGGQASTNLQSPQASSLQGGTSLDNNPSLSNITIANAPSGTTSTVKVASITPVKHHRFNSTMLAFPVILVLFAMVMFWVIRRSAKNTTKYDS